ncbi:MAG: PqqD family protein [Eubacterium sp.]
MKIKNGFAKRNIAGSNIVVPVGNTTYEFNGMITLNDSGAFFWDCFTKDITIDEAVTMVTGEYDVDADTARRDIEKFVALLEDNDLIEK